MTSIRTSIEWSYSSNKCSSRIRKIDVVVARKTKLSARWNTSVSVEPRNHESSVSSIFLINSFPLAATPSVDCSSTRSKENRYYELISIRTIFFSRLLEGLQQDDGVHGLHRYELGEEFSVRRGSLNSGSNCKNWGGGGEGGGGRGNRTYLANPPRARNETCILHWQCNCNALENIRPKGDITIGKIVNVQRNVNCT